MMGEESVPKGFETIIQIVLAVFGAYVAAFWFALVVWTFRDIQKRTRDVLVQVLATTLVLIFNVPGLILYSILRPPETLAESYARSLEEEALLQDIEDRQACPSCKRRVLPDYLVCPHCRTQLKQVCVNCGRLMNLSWDLCPFCGAEPEPGHQARHDTSSNISSGALDAAEEQSTESLRVLAKGGSGKGS